jgi:hypothetical protein
MSEHSLSGNKAKNDKSDKPTKPALPTDSVQAIISIHFILKKTMHNNLPFRIFFRLCHRILEKAIHLHPGSKAH